MWGISQLESAVLTRQGMFGMLRDDGDKNGMRSMDSRPMTDLKAAYTLAYLLET